MEHSAACLKMQAALKAFEEKHPNYCRNCSGAGYVEYKPTRDDPGDIDTCPKCLAQRKCPLCGDFIVTDESTDVSHCLNCDWTDVDFVLEGNQTGEIAPDVDCYCYEIDPPDYPTLPEPEFLRDEIFGNTEL